MNWFPVISSGFAPSPTAHIARLLLSRRVEQRRGVIGADILVHQTALVQRIVIFFYGWMVTAFQIISLFKLTQKYECFYRGFRRTI